MNFGRSAATILFVALLLFAYSGCGSSTEDESEAWLNEVILVNGNFQDAAAQGKKEIAAAGTTQELSAAYRGYAAKLRAQVERFEQIEPPDACTDEQYEMEQFMRKTTEVTEELGHQGSLTRSSFESLEERTAQAARGLIRALKPALAEEKGC